VALRTGLAGDKAADRMFSHGAMVSGLVTPEDDDLTVDEAKLVKATVRQAMTGEENIGDVAVINRKLKFQPWQMNAADAQFLESRTFQIDEVGRWFGVPPHLLGLTEKSTSWGQGIAEQNRGLARYTLTPWTTRIEQRLSRLVVGTKKVEFDYAGFIAAAPEDEIRLLIEQVNNGLLTLNEARRIRNMTPLPTETGADLPRVPPGAAPAPGQAAPAEGEPDEDDKARAREIAELLQKVYLAVGVVVTAAEARDLANRAGAGLDELEPGELGGRTAVRDTNNNGIPDEEEAVA
jgi:hypothetical protein